MTAKGLLGKSDKVEYKGNHATIRKMGIDRATFMEQVEKAYKGDPINKVVYNPQGSGSTVGRLECGRLHIFLKPLKTDPTHYESEAVSRITAQLKSVALIKDEPCVPIEVCGTVYHITRAEKVPSSANFPKADIRLYDRDHKEPVVFISHKAGYDAKAFQNYSGMSSSREENIFSSNSVQTYKKKLKEEFGETGMKNGDAVFSNIDRNDKVLRYRSIFGKKYGEKYGEDNCQLVCQGTITLRNSGKRTRDGQMIYTISANHVMENTGHEDNGIINSNDHPYAPVLLSNYRSGRNNFGIRNSRSGVYTNAYAKSRKAKEI